MNEGPDLNRSDSFYLGLNDIAESLEYNLRSIRKAG